LDSPSLFADLVNMRTITGQQFGLEAIMKTLPFWKEGLNQPAAIESSSLPSRVDVAIIGAGYTGLNAARVLAKNGTAVAILEQNTIGRHNTILILSNYQRQVLMSTILLLTHVLA